VFIVEQIDALKSKKKSDSKQDVPMHHLKAVCFLRPCAQSIQSLKEHLSKPRYKEYHLFFSNIVSEKMLRDIAKSDEFEVVKQVQEFYGDVLAVNPDLWHIGLPQIKSLYQPEAYWANAEGLAYQRNVDGIISMCLSQKRRPTIRYQGSSELCRRLAFNVTRTMKEEAELFHFQQTQSNPLLVIFDRREDPVTPLLMQWTYQAMVHELLGINNNRVNMRSVPGIRKELREIVLSCDTDRFFKGSMFLNFGDLGASIKDLVEDYQRKVKSNQKIATLDDMQRFVDNYPQFRQLSGNVSKHVAIMTELSRVVDSRDLMGVSELEQEIVCGASHSTALERILKLLDSPRLSDEDRLRLVCLYALRYENTSNELNTLKGILRQRASTDRARDRTRAVDALLAWGGSSNRGGDLFGEKKSIFDNVKKMFSSGIKGVDNIYTQHKPLLNDVLGQIIKDKLQPSDYPFVDGKSNGHDEIFVYVVGGATYEEAANVAQMNKTIDNVRIVLGGSFVHNSSSFIDDILGQRRDF
jgi:vacuolar protein sorting-associated protein 45